MEIREGRAEILGSTSEDGGTNFAVFSSVAERVELCLFDEKGAETRLELPGHSGSTWHGYVAGARPGQRYGYRVHGPWDPKQGHLCCADKLLLDPHARAFEGGVHWDDALFPYDPVAPDSPVNTDDSAPFVPRSLVVDDAFEWQDDRPPRTPIADTIIYEVHVKGFTRRHRSIPAESRGTYAGLVHPASIEHLTRLGITAVQLLPIQQFIHRRRLITRFRRNYWGYDPVGYFAPHNEYAGDRKAGVVREFKEMVRTLHQAGIEVILDVVFNHTGEGGTAGPVLAFRGLDNAAYYRVHGGDGLDYVDVTGTQNTVNAEHPDVRRMIFDALRYWVSEMHVDGFRFDLTPALVREGDDVNMNGAFFEQFRTDPVLADIKLIAEPWDIGPDGYRLGQFPKGWLEWNDKYRDDVRDFWRGSDGATGRFISRFTGSADIFRESDRSPQASVNYITCHDGFTLTDLVSYEMKHNEDNGEGNRDGHDDNRSWNCGIEGPTIHAPTNALRERQKRNLIITLLLAQGTPMLLGGDELSRTQRGNNNAYCQDNELSWFDWRSAAHSDWLPFVASVIRLRREHAVFRQSTWIDPQEGDSGGAVAWYDAGGQALDEGVATETGAMALQVKLAGGGDDADFLLMLNPTNAEVHFTSPGNGSWFVLIDTRTYAPLQEDPKQIRGDYTLMPHAAAVLSSRPIVTSSLVAPTESEDIGG